MHCYILNIHFSVIMSVCRGPFALDIYNILNIGDVGLMVRTK